MPVHVGKLLAFIVHHVASMRQGHHSHGHSVWPWAPGERLSTVAVQAELEAYLRKAPGSPLLKFNKGYPVYRSPAEEELKFLNVSDRLSDDAELSECRGNLSSIVDALTRSCQTEWGRKRCLESAIDVLRLGSDLIEASQIPRNDPHDQIVSPLDDSIPGFYFSRDHRGTYVLVQKLKFLQAWFVKLATPRRETILWSGFWTDPEAEVGASNCGI